MEKIRCDLEPMIRFMEILPKTGDIELTLLKCHLLIEEVLTKIILKSLKNTAHLKDARLTFTQKIKLARASNEITYAKWIWNALKYLNDARNELAHNLTTEEIKNKLKKFINYVKINNESLPIEDVSPKFSSFHWAVFAVYSVLAATAHFDPASLKRRSLLNR